MRAGSDLSRILIPAFGQPGRSPRYPQDVAWPADAFPFTYNDTTDPVSGATDGLMRRCRASTTCPKVMQTDTEYEYWNSRASLVVTDPTGKDIARDPMSARRPGAWISTGRLDQTHRRRGRGMH